MTPPYFGIIPKQGFEVCRDLIGSIILVELTNQKTLQGSDFPETIEGQVYAESLSPFDSSDQIAINVMNYNGKYPTMTQKDAQSYNLYLVDIYASGASSGESAFRRDKFLGMIMYIFRSAQYRQLGLSPGLVMGVYVENFIINQQTKEDTNYISLAQLQIAVRIYEDAAAWQGVTLAGNNSAVKLELSQKGYKFVYVNN